MSQPPKKPTEIGIVWLSGICLALCLGILPVTIAHAGKLTASAKLAKQTLTLKGQLSGVNSRTPVSFYDAQTGVLLYATRTNAKGAFNYTVPHTGSACKLRVEAQGLDTLVNISGAAKTCSLQIDCNITSPTGDLVKHEGEAVSFTANKAKKGVSISWDFGDGSLPSILSPAQHSFAASGNYKVILHASDAAGHTCTDDVVVAVAAAVGSNPNKAVPERVAPIVSPVPEGLARDQNSYVVLPFEEAAMMAGSPINLPYNTYVPMNSLNAQVFQKVEHKPRVIDPSTLKLYYSAASSPTDPAGAGSITSTSQNYFATGKAGANFNYDLTTADATAYIDSQAFGKAKIKKNEFWDKTHQTVSAKAYGYTEAGGSIADKLNATFKPVKPLPRADQGIPGNYDAGANIRAMPGVDNPYFSNDPQKFDYYADLGKFTAQFIPSTDIDDQGRPNPYPLMRIEARDSASKTVATTDAVYTTASETRCRECHVKGKIAAPDDLWRTPVVETELTDPADPNKPGPATGAGMFAPGKEPTKLWPPAIHNRFDMKNPFDANYAVTIPVDAEKKAGIERDQNNLRKDRVSQSRWINAKGATSDTRPNDGDSTWKLQLKLAFKGGDWYAKERGAVEVTWQDEEKAALWNTLLIHDYQVFYGLTVFTPPYAFSTQLTDYVEDIYKPSGKHGVGTPLNFCASTCHISEMRRDVGWSTRSFVYRYSDFSKQAHAFHAKLQAYKTDVTAGADGKPHKQGELIRNDRGHPIMWGGRGWDSQHTDDVAVGQAIDPATGKAKPWGWDVTKNNWREDLFPKRADAAPLFTFGDNVAMEDNCIKCHAGPTEKVYRDVHHAAGLKCDDCHGDMAAVGNLYDNPKYNANLWGAGKFTDGTEHFRSPFIDEPNCGSCHTGDANLAATDQGYFSPGALKRGVAANDLSGRTLDPVNARFAVMSGIELRPEKVTATPTTTFPAQAISQTLYRKSKDVHSSGAGNDVTCAACHGASHTIWPNLDPNANDNVTAKQLQGYDGTIVECSVCHIKNDFKTGLVATDGGKSGLGVAQGVRDGTVVSPTSTSNGKAYLAGPHGMHPVNDEFWWKHADGAAPNDSKSGSLNGGWHNDMAKMPGPDGEDQCAACHGADHKGTRLSRTLVDRVLSYRNKTIKVAANTIIGCQLCHSNTMLKFAPTGKAKSHAPAAPIPVVSK